MSDFFDTVEGREFVTETVPALNESMERLNRTLDMLVDTVRGITGQLGILKDYGNEDYDLDK